MTFSQNLNLECIGTQTGHVRNFYPSEKKGNQEEEKRKEGLWIFCGNILNYSIQADTAFTDSLTQGWYWFSGSETVISVL